MNISIKFHLMIKTCNGSIYLEIHDNNKCLYRCTDFTEGLTVVEVKIEEWPNKLKFFLSNRNKNDTKIDNDGNIIANKSIEVIGISINNFPLHIDLLDKVFDCRKEGSDTITNENWWAFNGTVEMDLNESDPMRFLLSHLNQYDINRLEWTKYEQR